MVLVVLDIEDVEEKDCKLEPTKIKTKDIIPSNVIWCNTFKL